MKTLGIGSITALFVLALPLHALAADRTPAPLSAEKAAKTSVLPDGFAMRVFAAEPDVTQPISFTIDAKGMRHPKPHCFKR